MPKPVGFELAGGVWVDSGTLMIVDPCYVDEGFDYNEWGDRIDFENDKVPGPVRGSYAMSTRWGDGTYPVYVKRDQDGRITAMLVDTDPELDEEYSDYPDDRSDLY